MAEGIGDELTPWLIRYAYSQGAFPMTMDDGSVEWFQPKVRALFPIGGIHVSHSLRRVLKQVEVCPIPQSPSPFYRVPESAVPETSPRVKNEEGGFRVTFDTAFEQVIRGCLRPGENWISEEFIRVYSQIHLEGWGHSAEVWRGEELVGGIYGIAMGSCFCAESMFHRATNASKVALWAMVEQCRSLGFTIFDAQVMNPHLKSLGAYPVRHSKYIVLLRKALSTTTPWSAA